MKRKVFTLLLAAGALLGISSVANAQLKGQPWNPMWDAVMRGNDTMNVCLPNRPAAPRPNPPHSAWNDSLRIRIYEGCPVRVDTAFIIPGGKNRRIVFKDMPKDHLERHYIVDAVTGNVFTEFDTIKLPDDTATTIMPLNFKHVGLSEGEPTYRDGYLGQIQLQIKMSSVWSSAAHGYVALSPYTDATGKLDSVKYQFFNLPKITNLDRRNASPRDSGHFSFKWSGALVNGVNGDPSDLWSSWEDTSIHSGDSVFKVAPAYYSMDNGATWMPCNPDGVDLTAREIVDMSTDVPVLVRLPNGCGSYKVTEIIDNPTPPTITRQVTINNKTDAQVEPNKQIYDVNTGDDFKFTVRASGKNVPKITTSRNARIADKDGVIMKDNGDGTYTFRVRRVQENLAITLEYTTDANVETVGARVWSENGQLYMTAATAGRANVYNVLGKLNRSVTLSAGETKSVSVPAGIYVVSMNNGKAYKVAVH